MVIKLGIQDGNPLSAREETNGRMWLDALSVQADEVQPLPAALPAESFPDAVLMRADAFFRMNESLASVIVLRRGDPRYVWIARDESADPENFTTGLRVSVTDASLEDRVRSAFPGMEVAESNTDLVRLHENLQSEQTDAFICALADWKASGLKAGYRRILSPAAFSPAAGQGAWLIRLKPGQEIQGEWSGYEHHATRAALECEQAFAFTLREAGTAAFGLATCIGDTLSFRFSWTGEDGAVSQMETTGGIHQAAGIGNQSARAILQHTGNTLQHASNR